MKNLTLNEKKFFLKFLDDNECGYETSSELLDDNFSCQTIEELQKIMDLNSHEIAGFLGSLETKGYILIEERDGAMYKGSNKMKKMNFEPDLYWVSDEILEYMNPDLKFSDMLKEL